MLHAPCKLLSLNLNVFGVLILALNPDIREGPDSPTTEEMRRGKRFNISSVEMYVKGRELRSDSASITAVSSSSNVNFDVPVILRSNRFML